LRQTLDSRKQIGLLRCKNSASGCGTPLHHRVRIIRIGGIIHGKAISDHLVTGFRWALSMKLFRQ
jgi:hypothetical protein